MGHQFRKHYSREEAKALLPQVRKWLQRLAHLRERLQHMDKRLGHLLEAGNDIGGDTVNEWIRVLCETRKVLVEFQSREIQVKDIERGLVDFPSLLAGREIFLCWENDEADIEFWHDLDTGFAGRERLP